VFVHSRKDHVVPFEWAVASYNSLVEFGANTKLIVVRAEGCKDKRKEIYIYIYFLFVDQFVINRTFSSL
jgi:dipeptidyl aminopeptidase/acylaminoacyl peptidase